MGGDAVVHARSTAMTLCGLVSAAATLYVAALLNGWSRHAKVWHGATRGRAQACGGLPQLQPAMHAMCCSCTRQGGGMAAPHP